MPKYGFDARYINAKAVLRKIFRPDDRAFAAGSSAKEFIVISQSKIGEGARGRVE